MSIDFDSTTLPIQHAEEEYDKEDYEREQELHQLLMTGLPDDMLEDSRDICSPELNYSRCSANNRGEQTWGQKGNWNDRDANSSLTDKVSYSAENPVPNGQNRGYIENDQYQRDYLCNAEYEQKIDPEQQDKSEPYLNGWNQNYRIDECQFTYKSKGHNFPCVKTNDEHYVSGKSYESNYCQLPDSYSSSDYHDYVNEPIEELHDQLEKMPEYPGSERDQPEHLQHFISNDTAELYKVKYNPYPTAHAPGGLFKTDEAQGAGNRFEEQQSKFLDCGEGSTEAHRFAQLQILYNARGRKLEEMQHKQEECAREIRYLNHQLAMTKGEKEGIAISCQELRNLLQNAKELEVRLEGQIKALESRIQDLGAGEEEALKNQKVAEAAMESMQQQLSELSRSESLTRAREQHENIISAFKDKHEETLLAMQQTLDATSISLEEQKENAKRLGEQVKQLQREQEEAKVEKAEIINGLTKSLEASQQQCRDLLQTGSMQEITQLRIQLQQLQSARNISDNMNKALQEELADLKEQIGLYESAAKVNAILKEVPEALESPLSDSYMGLCIKNDNLKMPKLQSAKRQGDLDKTLCKDGAIRELKGELERSLGNIRTKRHQVAQLQNELKQNQRQIAELKELLQNAEQLARNHEVRAISLEKQLETNGYASDKTLQDIVEQLRCETRSLHKEIEDKQQEIEKLIHSENQFKAANQDLYNEMRRMIQDFDQDKQEAIDRCERIHQQHHEDSKCRLEQELTEQHELEKAQITQFYEQQITQANAQLEQLNQEMSGVQESYITICKEKDSLECRLREEMSLKLTTEQEMKRTFSVQLQDNLTELHGKHKVAMEAAKQQWMAAKEIDIKLQIESQLGLAKTQWQEEQQKIKEQAIQEIETEWQLRLHKAVEQNTYLKRETGSQNKESFDREKEVYTCQELEAQIASLKMTMEQQAKEEKIVAVGKALQQLELELQKKHEDNIARQVEIALTKARERWLEELTNLPEYRANLQIEETKWGRKHEEDVEMKIATVLRENEEKWKKYALKESEKAGSSVKTVELQEKIHILERNLELQKEEASAVAKAELAKVQTQWNKEKQEEINRIHELNENDYRAFLDEHRHKLNEVLKAAKEDFTRQRNELLAQKDAELNLRILEKQKEWSAHQKEQIRREKQQYESELIAEIEHYLRQISKHIKKSETPYLRIEKCCDPINPIHAQVDKVKNHLQEVCTKLVEEILEIVQNEENKVDLQNALRQTEKQHEEYKTEKEAQLRKLELSELQLKQELNHLQQTLNITQPKELKRDHTSGTQNVNLECHQYEEQYQPQVLRKFQQECQQLKKKLEKMSRQLQLAVHEHKIDVMHLKEEHERTIKMMQNEKDDLLKKLKEKEIIGNKTNSCLQENCSSENSTKLISAKGLEEIRHQYLRAVDKIREDMLRYIQESKVRAAEMIRTEVFRERQQTARKMRKYYLTCLHQLLTDGGKNEGAEKKIMNAAGKLAAMAKAIETPLQNRKRDKAEIHTAQLTKKSSETAPNISENNGGVPASVHLQANQNVNSSSSEGQIQKFKKHTTDNATRKVSTPQIRNKSLFGAAVENSTSDEELSTTAKHVHSHKHKGKSGIFLKDATSMVNGAMSKSKYHRATSIAHCQNSSKYLSQMSLSKAHVFSSIDSLSDKAQLQTSCRQNSNLLSKELVQLRMACNQDNISSLKGYSENFICSETFTKPSSDVCETPERDDSDCAVNYDASNPHKMDRLSFKQTKGNTCHLDDYKMPIKCKMTSGISMSLSATNMQHKPVPISNGIEASPSISSAASDISSLSEDENACYLKKKIPALSRLHTQFAENACATNNREQSNTRTETGILYLTKDLIQKKHPSANSQNIGNIQQDSGFDSPFLNFH
ncbi:centrosomal protein of 152 kDa isoform X1 [Leucoraja erinacea]|uniref:centrosomal protein of 152 kDa isoform X1 n=1 Tax=Leucoraja erinaceus TaxID=7782 RepID=UPI0024577494|nr:centrosomal protein of 152 kDa isoform X1 [Leucoraja erinacea]